MKILHPVRPSYSKALSGSTFYHYWPGYSVSFKGLQSLKEKGEYTRKEVLNLYQREIQLLNINITIC